ncbi:MAG: DNA polymerase III subunit delta [Lachnospiraceae bacterium]|nr:DNA polymerase III subunit delta [Lachnospiraceae bacterium]
MAEKKKKEEAVNWVEKDIAEGTPASLYLLYGSESYIKKRNLNRLVRWIMPEDDGMNLAFFDEKKADTEQIISIADTMPAFAERRLIVVTNSGFFKKSCEALEEYLPKLPETTTLIFCESEVDKRLKLYKLAEKQGHCVEYGELTEKELQTCVVQILKREGKTMNRATFDHLTDRAGTSMQDLSVELEKLVCYTAGREMITIEDIDALVSPRLEEEVFDLTNAIAEKKRREAMAKYYELLAGKTSPMEIIMKLSGQFNRMFMIKSMRAKGLDPAAIASKLKIKPGAVFINEKLAAHFSMEELRTALDDCIRAEEAVKLGRMSDKLSVETLIIKYAS